MKLLDIAADLYRGPFLADFWLDDSDLFEDWALAKRESYRRQVLDALETLTTAALRSGSYQKAESYARRQLEIDDLRESASRQLMEALARSGRREEALAQYDRCQRQLRQELGMAPSARTTALYGRIAAGEVDLEAPVAPSVRGYELLEEIGVGAFGAVHKAYQPAVDRQVAVKIILPQYANQPEFIRRFEVEAQTVARLEHPYIVPLYDYWREPNGAYLVMRYLQGGSLSRSLAAGESWTGERAVQLVEQVASALATAHSQGVVHRDIKPANILLDKEGNAYLSDFGIAKDILSLEGAGDGDQGSVTGSPAYISPEQILNEPVTAQSDIYSLGLVLYELLMGEVAYPEESLTALLHQQLSEPVPLLMDRLPELPPDVDAVIQRATAKRPADRYADALDLARAFREAMAIPITAPVPWMPAAPDEELVNPYKGLRAFQEADAGDFFGREALVGQLIGRMGVSMSGDAQANFLAVVGPSGSGKSSAVKAGLIPALRGGALPGSEKWFIVEIAPGRRPMEELEAGLLPVAVDPPASLLEPLQKDERGFIRTLKRILPPGNGEPSQILLVVDQFEELFTLVESEEERTHFIDSLLTALEEPRSPLRVLITLRADFYDRPLAYQKLGELLRARTELVLPMNSEELERAICQPAEQAGAVVDPGLVSSIKSDVQEQPGMLPLLQYALTELFERRQDGILTQEAYRDIGGVAGALGRRAEEIFASLNDEAKELGRQVFLRLVTLGEGIEDTRRRVTLSEVETLATSSRPLITDHRSLFTATIGAYGSARLLTFDRDPSTREPTVEVAHEALLREWERLRGWMDESRADVRLQRLLGAAAAEWLNSDRDMGFLQRGSRLTQFEDWTAETDLALTGNEREYLEASLAERRVREAAEVERQAHEAELERRSRNQLRALVGVFAVAAIIAIFLTIFAFGQRNSAQESEALAQSNAATATVAQGEAVFQASTAEAERVRAEEESLARATQQTVAEEQALARATAQSLAEEQQIIAEEQRSLAEEQRVVAENEARTALEAYSQSLAAHVDNALEDKDSATALALAMESSMLDDPPALTQRMLRQAAYAPGPRKQFQVADTFPGVDGRVYSLAMSPNESVVLIGFEDGTLILWDLSTKTEIHRLKGHDGIVRTVAFSPDGQTALSGASDRAVILWDLETGQEIRRFEGHDGWVRTVSFSPDGLKAVSGGFVGDSVSSVSNPGQLVLWDLASGQEIRRFEGHPSGVVAAAFAPDGRAILASSGFFTNVDNEYSLMLWDAETGQKTRDFEITGDFDHFSLAISPDGHTALTGTSNNEVILWDMDSGQRMLILEGHTGTMVTSVAYTPDGRRAISGDANGQVILWDLASGDPSMRAGVPVPTMGGWHASDGPVLNLVSSANGRKALSSAGDGTLVLWDLVDAGEIRRFEGHQSPVIAGVAFTPDGKYALTGEWGEGGGFTFGESNSLRLWDVETGEELRSFEGHTAAVVMITVSGDGRQALTASGDGTMRLWDLETGEEIRQILAHEGSVYAVAVSPDGRLALTGSVRDDLADSGIALWNLESGQVIHRLRDQGGSTTLAFNPDGQTVYSDVDPEEYNYTFGQYDIDTGQFIRGVSTFRCCTGFAIHPDGRSVFLATNRGGPVVEWDLEADHEIRAYGQHPGARTRVEVSYDGRLLLVSAWNFAGGILSLWDLETGQEIRRFSGDGICCMDIDMSPDGTMAITPAGGGTAILWDLSLPVEMEEVRDWIDDNRYVRELSCEERDLYRIEPLCEG